MGIPYQASCDAQHRLKYKRVKEIRHSIPPVLGGDADAIAATRTERGNARSRY